MFLEEIQDVLGVCALERLLSGGRPSEFLKIVNSGSTYNILQTVTMKMTGMMKTNIFLKMTMKMMSIPTTMAVTTRTVAVHANFMQNTGLIKSIRSECLSEIA